MIKRKKKKCVSCGVDSYIFSKGRCKRCASIDYVKKSSGSKRKLINKISKNYSETLKLYKPLRKAYLLKHPKCELVLSNCTGKATCIHHKAGKAYRELYLDTTKWMASCISCNREVEEIGSKAYDLGLKIKHTEL